VGHAAACHDLKVSYTGSVETFKEVVSGCSVPVVIAGGPKMDSDYEILEMVKGSIDAGGKGVSIGRNVFQHKDPTRMVRAISAIVHEGCNVEDALKILNEE
jgi:DhnA family fructose-bisphosphate aldolase class Ia